MSLVIVQLSDFHFSTSKTNGLLEEREPALHGAIRSVLSKGDHCLVMYSGDIANGGKEDEYAIATTFIKSLNQIILEHTEVPPLHALVPGNHDLDFNLPGLSTKIRDLILSDISPINPPDEQMLEQCLAPQKPFRDFISKLAEQVRVVASTDRLQSNEFDFGAHTVRLHLLNTAHLSSIQEKAGSLWFPVNLLEKALQDSEKPDVLTICSFHHPYSWYQVENSKKIRSLIEEHCDIIFTGHEHFGDYYQKTKRTTQQNIYIEGGVLQEHEAQDQSSFNLIKLNYENKAFLITSFAWDGESYKEQNEPYEYRFVRLRKDSLAKFNLSEEWENWLEQVGTDFRHPRCPKLCLSDIFVYPDLQKLDVRKTCSPSGLVKDGEIIGFVQDKKRICIAGAEKAGKTSLAKRLFLDLRQAGLVPVLIGKEFSISKSKTITFQEKLRTGIDRSIFEIYDSDGCTNFWRAKLQDRALIIDDYDRLPLSLEGRNELLDWCDKNFGVIVLLASPGIRFSDILERSDKNICLLTYEHADILESDSETQWHLIRKWLIAGVDRYQSDSDDLYNKTVRYVQVIGGMIGQGVVPSLPLSILMMAQQMESGGSVEGTNGLYGSLYEVIIRDVLRSAVTDPGDFEVKLNYLTYYAYALYRRGEKFLSKAAFLQWHRQYCVDFHITINESDLVLQLKAAGIFRRGEEEIGYKYKYYYCFFLARYLSQNMHDAEVLTIIETFCKQLHNSDIANTMLFLCHLCKDPRILELILATVKGNFRDAIEYDIRLTPALVPKGQKHIHLALGSAAPETERVRHCEEEDARIRPHGLDEMDKTSDTYVQTELMPIVNEANSAHHSIRICGQILRNFYGSLRGEQKLEIIKECYGVGLRMMSVLFEWMEKEKEQMAEAVSEVIQHRHPKLSDDELDAKVRQSIYGFALLISYGIIKHTSNCLGLAALKPTFDAIIMDPTVTISQEMLDISTRLDFFDEFPEKQVLEMAKRLEKMTLGREALRFLVWENFKLFKRDYKLRQRVCPALDIDVSQPAIIDVSTKRQNDGKPIVPVLMPPPTLGRRP